MVKANNPEFQSWVEVAKDSDFPIQNLPFGVIRTLGSKPRLASIIGDYVIDLAALANLGFPVSGWSRSPKTVGNITCHHGPDGLRAALQGAEIVILLLPLTAGTENILDADALALLPKGAVIINPGRGPLIDDAALLGALDSGQIGHATLDVFREEPLPENHPFWHHDSVTVTPHIASETRPKTASESIARNIARAEAGKPLLHLVDRGLGY